MLLRQDVMYEDVAAEVRKSGAAARVWWYADRWSRTDEDGKKAKVGWYGLKGVWMTPAWCEEMSVMLENTNFQHYKHVDMWLVGLLKQEKARGFQLLPLLAGYGHRISMSESQGSEKKFGGCFLRKIPVAAL